MVRNCGIVLKRTALALRRQMLRCIIRYIIRCINTLTNTQMSKHTRALLKKLLVPFQPQTNRTQPAQEQEVGDGLFQWHTVTVNCILKMLKMLQKLVAAMQNNNAKQTTMMLLLSHLGWGTQANSVLTLAVLPFSASLSSATLHGPNS